MISKDELFAAIKKAESEDSELFRIVKLIESGNPTYEDATRYAERLGKILSMQFGTAFNGLEFISIDEAMKTVSPVLENAYKMTAQESGIVQKSLNTRAGISINAQIPQTNESRIAHLIEKLSGGELKDTGWLLDESVISNFTRSAVTDTIEENARIQKAAGLHSFIERDPGWGCCKWCNSLAGRYEYGEQPDDFFKVHKDCTCKILFQPAKERWQKITYYQDSDGVLRKRTVSI